VLFITAAEVNRGVVCHVNKWSILDQSSQFPVLGIARCPIRAWVNFALTQIIQACPQEEIFDKKIEKYFNGIEALSRTYNKPVMGLTTAPSRTFHAPHIGPVTTLLRSYHTPKTCLS
jgi:hypothetical protein